MIVFVLSFAFLAGALFYKVMFGHESPYTKNVRLAIGINSEGEWSVCGWPDATDEEMREDVLASFGEGLVVSVVFVSARVPIPVEPEVRGKAHSL